MPSEWGACVQHTLDLVVAAMLPNVISGLKLWQQFSNVDWLPLWHMQCYQLGRLSGITGVLISP